MARLDSRPKIDLRSKWPLQPRLRAVRCKNQQDDRIRAISAGNLLRNVEMVAHFEIAPEISAKDGKTMRNFNSALDQLAQRRVERIEITGPYSRSRLAWKVATYQQPMLYRIVGLGSGIALNWNARNLICSYLSARALIETVAVLLEFESQLQELLEKDDLASIDGLVMKSSFGGRDEDLMKEHPDFIATNVLTSIDRIDRDLLRGLRRHYDRLSETCHPNSLGHHQLFGSLDTEAGIVTYSDVHKLQRHLNHILAAAILLGFGGTCMDRLDIAILKIAKLQHAAHPVVDNW